MGLFERLFRQRERRSDAEGEGAEAAASAVPDWVSRDVEAGFVKVRLFLSPPGQVPSLYELDLPEGSGPGGGLLRCFRPPPNGRGGGDGPPTKAWTREVSADEMGELSELARDISLFPVGGPGSSDEAGTVELSLTSGQAEARIRWWMSPPGEWGGVDRFVRRLRALAEGEPRHPENDPQQDDR